MVSPFEGDPWSEKIIKSNLYRNLLVVPYSSFLSHHLLSRIRILLFFINSDPAHSRMTRFRVAPEVELLENHGSLPERFPALTGNMRQV